MEVFADDFVAENCYVVWDAGGTATVIDPGLQVADVRRFLEHRGLTVARILLTHGHMDHVAGVTELRDLTGAPVTLHSADVPMVDGTDPWQARAFGFAPPAFTPDEPATPGSRLRAGHLVFEVLFTPGHSPGHVTYCLLDDVFSGDCLFAGSIGRTDLPGGDMGQLMQSITSVILPLGDDCRVFPGHGEATTVLRERRTNPFLLSVPSAIRD